MEDFEGILSNLNDLQREATLFEHKQLLQIKAPPGSGKTRIVISRLMFLVIVCKIPASKIVVTTFGKKAAHEIKERLIDLVPTDQKYLFMDLNVGTFHSLCLKLLMKHGYRIGLHNPTIISEAEQKLIFQNAIAALPTELYDYYLNHQNIVNVVKWEKKENKTQDDKNLLNFEIPMILKYISKLKSQGLTAEKYRETSGRNLDQGILYFYETYERDAREMQKVDFDDLLLYGYKLLKRHEASLPYYNHILVDEFQDTSALQLQIVLLWAKKAKSGITVVGDPDQCIYAFRDASPSNFKDMRHLCGKVTVIPLNQNYRSSQKIIDCCQHIIKSNFNDQQESSISEDDSINDNPIDEFESALCGQFDTDFGPVYREFTSFDQEAMHISNEIKYLTSLPGDIMKFSEIAVLVRTNRQITTIEKHMITNHIPYRIIGSKGFLSYPEVVLFMNCLKLVVNFKNRDKALFSNKKVWILEILNEIENNGIGEISLLNIHKYFATKGDIDPIDLLLEVSEHDKIVTNTKGREYIKAFMKKFLMPCSDFASSLDGSEECLSRFFAYIYKKSGLEKAYNGMSSKDEDSKSELEKRKEEIMKSKHNRIMTLKEMFLGFAPLKTQQKNYTLPFVYEFIESIDMFPVEENGIDPAADEKKSNASDINDENNRVTICTVHKSKGLEWSTVFVPGCSEKIIPCLISSNEDANNNGEKLTEENVSFEKYKSTSVSANQMIQEEKRVFYVALSRAKHLLYITAIDNEEKADNKQSSNRRSMIRSRFLKQDLIDRLNAYSSVFSSIKTVKQLYEIKSVNFKTSFDPIKNDFSLKTFLKDYETYIEEKSWQLYWMGKKVYNLNGLDVTKNIRMSTSTMMATGFVSAKQHVAQMAEKTQSSKQPKVKRGISLSNPVALESPAPKASQNNFAPKVKYVKKPRGLTIPTQVPSPKKTNVLLSPKKKLEFAPRNDSEILKSPKRKPLKASESPTKAAKNNKDNISNCDISNLSLDGDKENPYVNIAIKTEKKDAEIDPTQQKKKGSQKTIDQMFKLQRGKKRKRVDTSIETITLSD